MGIWQKIRNWIDRDEGEHLLEDMVRNTASSSPSMQFIVRIVDLIRADLVSGSYIPSTEISPAYFPSIYYVFISAPDAKDWTGERLDHLRARVAEGTMRKINELDKRKTTQTVHVEVKTDGTLNPGQVRVQPSNETTPTHHGKISAELPTVPDTTTELPTLYSIEVYEGSDLVATHKVVYGEIYVGRDKSCLIRLDGDNRVGRVHASFILEDGVLVVSALHDNPIRVDSDVITKKEKRTLSGGEKIGIYNHTLVPRI